MVFPYYNRLTEKQKRVYRRSNEIDAITLPNAVALTPLISEIEATLKQQQRQQTQVLCQGLLNTLTSQLAVPALRLTVRATRPHNHWGELHGLYEPGEDRGAAHISIWMRTAQRKQVVAFRTFLRTLLHELCHHLDYELFKLPETFHTEGFYKRESSLLAQLLPREPVDGKGLRAP